MLYNDTVRCSHEGQCGSMLMSLWSGSYAPAVIQQACSQGGC